MRAKLMSHFAVGSACLLCLCAAGARAQDSESGPLRNGPYFSSMASYILTDHEAFDSGIGGTLAAGYRNDWWGVEGSAVYGTYGGADGGKDTDAIGGTINGLVFPVRALPRLFALAGAGGLRVDRHPVVGRGYSMTTFEGGLGYIWGFAWGRYEFGVRADARYRYGKRHQDNSPGGELPIETDFTDILLNVGLQLPLGFKEQTLPPPAPEVVPPSEPEPAEAAPDTTTAAEPTPVASKSSAASEPSASTEPPTEESSLDDLIE